MSIDLIRFLLCQFYEMDYLHGFRNLNFVVSLEHEFIDWDVVRFVTSLGFNLRSILDGLFGTELQVSTRD